MGAANYIFLLQGAASLKRLGNTGLDDLRGLSPILSDRVTILVCIYHYFRHCVFIYSNCG